jgi:multimeric flavodoxin WrbA
MNILTIIGTPRKGNTRALTDLFKSALADGGDTLDEIVLPRDFGDICCGCTACILHGEEKCPHRERIAPLIERLEKADLIILATPVFVMSCSSAMKAFLDHLAFMWLVHRPREAFFNKTALVIAAAAGSGVGDTVKLMKKNLFYLGVPQVFDYGITAIKMGGNYEESPRKETIKRQVSAKAARVKRAAARPRVGLKTRLFFNIFRIAQKTGWNKLDADYWREKGWLDGKKPF